MPDAEFNARDDAAQKDVSVAYVLWFVLGGLGAHRFYLGRMLSGGIYLALVVLQFMVFPPYSLDGLDGFIWLIWIPFAILEVIAEVRSINDVMGVLIFFGPNTIIAIWWIVDSFLMPRIVKSVNNKRMDRLEKEKGDS